MIPVTRTLALQEDELHESFVRSSGPGGQNVNKVSSAVQLRFDAARSDSLPADIRDRLLRLAGKRRTADGQILIEANRYRTQEQNRRDALERLIALIRRAAAKPPRRVKTKPTAASKARRVDEKKQRGQTKRLRKKPPME